MAASSRLVTAVALAVLAGTLAGCTGESDPPAPSPSASGSSSGSASGSPSASPTESDDLALQVAVYGDGARLRAYRQMVSAFEVSHPDVEVELTAFDDETQAAEAALEGLEEGWEQDVFLADYRSFADLVETEGLQPVDALLESRGLQFGDDYQRSALTAFSAEDRLQCMPAEVSPLVVYVNKRLYRRARLGPQPLRLPNERHATWGWRDFLRLSRGVAQIDGSGPVKGVAIPLDADVLTALVRSAGGDLVDDVFQPTRFDLESDGGVRAVSELVGLARDTIVTPTRAELGDGGARELFTAGRLGMLVGTRADLPALRAADDLRFDVLPMPSLGSQASVSRMNAFCITLDTPALGPAADFVAFAVSDEGARIAARSDEIVPSTLDIVHDPAFTQPDQLPRHSYVFATSIRRSEPMPYVTGWDEIAAELEAVLRTLVRRRDVDLRAKLLPRLERFDERSAELFPDAP